MKTVAFYFGDINPSHSYEYKYGLQMNLPDITEQIDNLLMDHLNEPVQIVFNTSPEYMEIATEYSKMYDIKLLPL